MKERAALPCATSKAEVCTKSQNLHLRNFAGRGGHKPRQVITSDELSLESRPVNSKMPRGEMVPLVLRMPSRRSGFLRILLLAFAIVALSDCPASSQGWFQHLPPPTSASSGQLASVPQDSIAFDRVVDQVIQTEKEFPQTIRNFTPLVETYIQNLKPELELGTVPVSDQYLLGRLDLSRGLSERSFLQQPRLAGWLANAV